MSEWKMVKLGEVCNFLSGFAFDSNCFTDTDNGIPLIRIRDVVRGYSNTFYIGEYDDKYIVKKGDFLIGMDGEFNIGEWAGVNALLNQRVCKILPHINKLNDRFLFHYLPKALKEIESKTAFVTVKHLSVNSIKDIEIPLPPLETQQKIAAILDKANNLTQLRKTQIEKLDLLIKSKFIDMFGDPVTNPMGWEIKSLKNITTKIGSGATPKGGKGSYKSKGISLVRSMNVHGGCFKYDNLAYLDEKQAKQLDIVTLQDEDVLINITGASVARSCIVPSDILPARVNQHVSIIRCKSSIANPFYVNHIFMSDGYQRLLLSIGSAGGATREAITKQELEQLNIPLPPISLQTHFRIFVGQVEQQKNVLNQSLKKLEMNYKALMQGCFNGELFQ